MPKKKPINPFASEVLVYVCEWDDGVPILAVANSVSDIPPEVDGEVVAAYVLGARYRYKVRRDLIVE